MTIHEKRTVLRRRLRELAPLVIAFSGGKDSAFLAAEAAAAVGRSGFTAVFIDSPLSSALDLGRLSFFQKKMNIAVRTLRLDPRGEEEITRNGLDRCYFCKGFLFSSLLRWMAGEGLGSRLIDGSTASDSSSYRPGARAAAELGVFSPLREAGIRSEEIVVALKARRVPAIYLHSSSCLATRVPYGRRLEEKLLRRVEAMESFWHRQGIHDVRCRAVEQGCRVELPHRQALRALRLRGGALEESRTLGFRWLALDLEPVRPCPWDPEGEVGKR